MFVSAEQHTSRSMFKSRRRRGRRRAALLVSLFTPRKNRTLARCSAAVPLIDLARVQVLLVLPDLPQLLDLAVFAPVSRNLVVALLLGDRVLGSSRSVLVLTLICCWNDGEWWRRKASAIVFAWGMKSRVWI